MTSKKEFRDLAELIDPMLDFVDVLYPESDDSRFVLKVGLEGMPYVLKGTHQSNNLNEITIKEKRNLYQAKMHKLGGVTHMIQDYPLIGDYNAMLKEFYGGHELNSPLKPLLKIKLHYIMKFAHKKGFSNLDMRDENIIINPMRSDLKLIDFESDCVLRWHSESDYLEGVEIDKRNLARL